MSAVIANEVRALADYFAAAEREQGAPYADTFIGHASAQVEDNAIWVPVPLLRDLLAMVRQHDATTHHTSPEPRTP